MTTKILPKRDVILMSDDDRDITPGKPTTGTCIIKDDGRTVIFSPRTCHEYERANHNPYLYKNKFFSSRIKKNGNISLHATITDTTHLTEAWDQACAELDEFFTKLQTIL